MREKTKAYMAGIVEAEGCFSISKRAVKNSTTIHYEPHIIFTGSDPKLGTFAVKMFGGTCTRSVNGKYFHWQARGSKNMVFFLESVLPYLRFKKDQALILLQYLRMNGDRDPVERQKLFQQIKELKNQGSVETDTLDGSTEDKKTHAYLAGIFDGEGSMSLYGHNREGGIHYVKFLAVTNTEFALLFLFKRLYGGTIRKKIQPGRQCWEWNLRRNSDIEHFLLCVLPYLIVKRDRAKILLNFVRLGSTSDIAERYRLYSQMRTYVSTKNANPKIQPVLCGDVQSALSEMIAA